MKYIILFLIISFNCGIHSQIHLQFNLNGRPIISDSKLKFQNDSSWIQIDELKFYLLYAPFFSDETIRGASIIHLVDLNDTSTYVLPFTEDGNKTRTQFDFAIGLDSNTTMSTQFSGALDPALGMYWAWNTGYIHFKLEGRSNLCKNQKQEFLYHIGGYYGKYNTQRWLSSSVKLKSGKPTIIIDLADFLKEILLLNKYSNIMIPGKEAVAISDCFKLLFKK